MEPIKVLHLIQGLEIGGLENMVVSLSKGVNRCLYQPAICCYDTLGTLASSLNGTVNVHFLKRNQGIDYTYPFKLAKLLRKEKVHILHLHNSTAFFYGVIAGGIARVPVIVYTEHARDVFPNLKVRIADKFLSLFTNKVIVVADFLKKNLIKYEWFNPSKVMTIYNGIDGSKFKAEFDKSEIKRGLGLSENSRIIGMVARLDPIKNHKSLIMSMQSVIKKFPEAILLIIGDGPIRNELEVFVEKCDLKKNVTFLWTRHDIPQLLSVMDIFVLCSMSEGLPITLLEAMAGGKPIVATRVGGIPEVIEHNINGLLIPSGNIEALLDAILELLRDTEKAKQLGAAAERKFERNFSLSSMVEKYQEVYEALLQHVQIN
jgi:sugar transferase (PEP-CTERM/EpsH1 system associated)